MNYRSNNKNGDKLSILGYGCMRFPKKGNSVDEERTERQIISAIEQGVNYFDTAYIYHGGKSEIILGQILAKGYRDRVKIATKMPPFMVRKSADMDKIFNTQLKRLQTDHIDYYLMHMLPDVQTWERLKTLGIIEWIDEKKKSGQIINLGFSYHGGTSEFMKIIDAYDWDFCQIQYNYLDENNQAGRGGLNYAASKGIPIVVMEPLRGGKIVDGLPKEVDMIWKEAKPSRSAADWALRWVWNQPEVMLALSGMNNENQIAENIRVASEAQANDFTSEELALFATAKEILSKKTKVNCTACGYCMPCPSGVDIPTCFSCYNQKYMNKNKSAAFFNYITQTGATTSNPTYASRCTKCRKCEQHCPQNILISEKMAEVKKDMENVFFKPIVAVAKKFMK
ncbi:MAG: aldo/keto reductase [Peptostreptococcaceae bacterium]|nr:aldo/keto reductase [Peptostreptococcaceae bacterium]